MLALLVGLFVFWFSWLAYLLKMPLCIVFRLENTQEESSRINLLIQFWALYCFSKPEDFLNLTREVGFLIFSFYLYMISLLFEETEILN